MKALIINPSMQIHRRGTTSILCLRSEILDCCQVAGGQDVFARILKFVQLAAMRFVEEEKLSCRRNAAAKKMAFCVTILMVFIVYCIRSFW